MIAFPYSTEDMHSLADANKFSPWLLVDYDVKVLVPVALILMRQRGVLVLGGHFCQWLPWLWWWWLLAVVGSGVPFFGVYFFLMQSPGKRSPQKKKCGAHDLVLNQKLQPETFKLLFPSPLVNSTTPSSFFWYFLALRAVHIYLVPFSFWYNSRIPTYNMNSAKLLISRVLIVWDVNAIIQYICHCLLSRHIPAPNIWQWAT